MQPEITRPASPGPLLSRPARGAGTYRRSGGRPPRVVLVGTDSLVSRVLLTFLRTEGFEAGIVSEDAAIWAEDPENREWDGGATALTPRVIIIAPTIVGAKREALVRRLREDGRTSALPIITLHEAGDAWPLTAGGRVGGAGQWFEGGGYPGSDLSGAIDAQITWPFRLREILAVLHESLGEPARAGRT